MKKIVTFGESELINMVKRIVEQSEIDLGKYHDSDFVDVFVFVFRNWLNNKLGEDAKKYPFSYLTKRYGQNFLEDTFGDKYEKFFGSDRDVSFGLHSIPRIGQKLVKVGAYSLQSLRDEEKFTEKFAKKLLRFVKMLNLPDWMKLEFVEEKPLEVEGILHVDYPSYLKYEGERVLNANQLGKELRYMLENYLGVDFGNPTYGELQLDITPKIEKEEWWIKNVLNKEIKKHIKTMPGGEFIHSIRFAPKYPHSSEMKIVYKDNFFNHKLYGKDFNQWKFKEGVKKYLKELGYNKIHVE